MNVASGKPITDEIGTRANLRNNQDSSEPQTAIERAREKFKIMMVRRRAQKPTAGD